MKVAFDENYSNDAIARVARLGHEIVYVAKKGERDDDWLSTALARGAEVIVSRDLDIPNLLDYWKSPARWIEYTDDIFNGKIL